mmetsp:Transcript_141478/g.359343  ORF Transcript_141478/g.359343 Transcript_141478/m.359343 type:complete len:311 (+) Transcript_141478:1829-2761(+)
MHPMLRMCETLLRLKSYPRVRQFPAQISIAADPRVTTRTQGAGLVRVYQAVWQFREAVPDDLWEHLAIHLKLRPIPIGQANAAVIAERAVSPYECLLEIAKVTPVPTGEGLLPMGAEIRRPPVVARYAEVLRGLRAVLVLHGLQQGRSEPLLFAPVHGADLLPHHHRAPTILLLVVDNRCRICIGRNVQRVVDLQRPAAGEAQFDLAILSARVGEAELHAADDIVSIPLDGVVVPHLEDVTTRVVGDVSKIGPHGVGLIPLDLPILLHGPGLAGHQDVGIHGPIASVDMRQVGGRDLRDVHPGPQASIVC